MPAYILVSVTIHDPVLYEEYRKLTPATIAAYDGKFIVRGGQSELLEGSQLPGRTVVLEFPTYERAKEWWNAPEYAEAKAIRQKAADTTMIVIEGY